MKEDEAWWKRQNVSGAQNLLHKTAVLCTEKKIVLFNTHKCLILRNFQKGKFLRKSKKTLFSHNCVKGSKKNKFDNKTTKKHFPPQILYYQRFYPKGSLYQM